MAAAIPIILAVGSIGAQVAGAAEQGRAAEQAATANAQAGELNAQEATLQSQDELRRQQIMARKVQGQARASYAASGVSIEGSALDVLQESASNAAEDALNIQHKGERQAAAYRAGARLDIAKGESASLQSKYGAAASLLGGASKVYDIANK